MLTLNTQLPSEDFPEFLGSMVVNAFLNELDIVSSAAHVSLTLNKISQLRCLNTISEK